MSSVGAGHGLNETFSVRRISYGEGVERVFPLHSPRVDKIEVERHGQVRRAKLTYLRKRLGKGATLCERKAGKKPRSNRRNNFADNWLALIVLVYRRQSPRGQSRSALFDWIETFCTRECLHSPSVSNCLWTLKRT